MNSITTQLIMLTTLLMSTLHVQSMEKIREFGRNVRNGVNRSEIKLREKWGKEDKVINFYHLIKSAQKNEEKGNVESKNIENKDILINDQNNFCLKVQDNMEKSTFNNLFPLFSTKLLQETKKDIRMVQGGNDPLLNVFRFVNDNIIGSSEHNSFLCKGIYESLQALNKKYDEKIQDKNLKAKDELYKKYMGDLITFFYGWVKDKHNKGRFLLESSGTKDTLRNAQFLIKINNFGQLETSDIYNECSVSSNSESSGGHSNN